MNKNFMNNLSDEVIRQNYKLKDELIQARKTIKGTQTCIDRLLVKNRRDDRINVTVVLDIRGFGGEVGSFQ